MTNTRSSLQSSTRFLCICLTQSRCGGLQVRESSPIACCAVCFATDWSRYCLQGVHRELPSWSHHIRLIMLILRIQRLLSNTYAEARAWCCQQVCDTLLQYGLLPATVIVVKMKQISSATVPSGYLHITTIGAALGRGWPAFDFSAFVERSIYCFPIDLLLRDCKFSIPARNLVACGCYCSIHPDARVWTLTEKLLECQPTTRVLSIAMKSSLTLIQYAPRMSRLYRNLWFCCTFDGMLKRTTSFMNCVQGNRCFEKYNTECCRRTRISFFARIRDIERLQVMTKVVGTANQANGAVAPFLRLYSSKKDTFSRCNIPTACCAKFAATPQT